ncbi:MAG TPA: PASTA domain-containing protein [Candidatus Limnocylindrales bacterium]
MRSRGLRWLRLPARPAGRASASMLTIGVLLGTFAVAAGVGYTASRPLLGDGCAFLGKGHTVAHVCGETGKSDAEIAARLATGKEDLQPVRLPDGRLAILNRTTGTLSYFDSATLTPTSVPTARPESAGTLEPIPTSSDGYLVDPERKTVERIAAPEQPAAQPIRIPDGITAAAPTGDSLWVMTPKAEVVEVADGRVVRTIRLGVAPVGITVADSHPVVVAEDGNAYTLDAASPKLIGNLRLTGRGLKLGTWRGAGRYVVAVEPGTGRVAVLDPRTGNQRTVQLNAQSGRTELDNPVTLGEWVYVPDRAGPGLWRIDLAKGTADDKPLDVPGQPGAFRVTVESGRVWANSQYDRRVLVVDADGHHQYADKGPSPEIGDSESPAAQPGPGGGTPQPGAPPPPPPQETQPNPQPGGPTAPATPTVTIPSFPARTPYRQACAELTRMKLVCRAVPAGDRDGLRTGDVIETDPRAGATVPEGSRVVVRYAGPLKTPSVVGLWHEEACRQIIAAKLKCAATIDPNPALAPAQLGTVTSQSPGPQEQLPKGGTVSVTYSDTIELPSFIGQSWSAACDQIGQLYRMKCESSAGDPPPAGKQVGQVYNQNPAVPFVARIGTTITLRYYRGTSKVPPVTSKQRAAACADIQREGFACKQVEGVTAWGSGSAAGVVYQQSPTADGRDYPVGTEVTVVYYSSSQDLPNYGGTNAEAACADLNARGFQCHRATQPLRTTNIVEGQSVPAGRHALGTAVTIVYNPHPLIDWWISKFGSGWAMVSGSGTYRIGFGYPVNASWTSGGGQWVYQYTCGAGGTACRGHPQSVFYSRIVPPGTGYVDPQFTGNGFTIFMACTGAPGQRRVWRTWNIDADRKFTYGLLHHEGTAKPAGYDDAESLGCIWW